MQHLNFYSQLDHEVELLFSVRQQLWVMLIGTVLMIVIAVVVVLSKHSLELRLNELQGQQQQLAAELEQLNQHKQQELKNDTLLAEIKSVESDVVFRRKLLANIDPNGSQAQSFSEHLTGLARQHINGMWFTEIHLLAAGQQMALSGKTQKPEYVPRYLKNLSKEAVFQGHQFRVLRLNAAKDSPGLMDFELRAHELEAQP